MGIEIERKFLVIGDDWRRADAVRISQGYLNRDRKRTVRVRIADDRGYLTIKGPTTGASRAEYEYEVPLDDAERMMDLCEGPVIDKRRYLVPHGDLVWEVDEFGGDNAGLIVAEVELTSEDQTFAKPPWAGEEVTHDMRYSNSNLAAHPFLSWA